MARQQLVKRTHILAYNPIFRHFYSEHGRKSTTRSKEWVAELDS